MSQIDIVRPTDRPELIPTEESAWSAISRVAYSQAEKGVDKKYADAGTQGNLEAMGFPKVTTMTAETQAAGQLDVLLRDWNGQPFSEDQMQQIAKSIRDGVFGCKDPCAVQRKLKEMQLTLNSYLQGAETPFRDSTSSAPMKVWLAVDNESNLYMGVRNYELKKGEGFVFPLVEGREPKFQRL